MSKLVKESELVENTTMKTEVIPYATIF